MSLQLEFSCTDFIFNYSFGILCCLRQCTACHSLLTQEMCSAVMCSGMLWWQQFWCIPRDHPAPQPLSLGANLICTHGYKNKASLEGFSSEYSPGAQDFCFGVLHIKLYLVCSQDLWMDFFNHKSVQNYLNSWRLLAFPV